MATKSKQQFDWTAIKSDTIIGVDEVGRGCLAGPVYAAAAILDYDKPYKHFTDSKKLTPLKREILTKEILQNHRVEVGFATVEEISELNILHAALLAMQRAVKKLKQPDAHVLVDGNKLIPGLEGMLQTTVVKGDLLVPAIGAASIVAKVTRDKVINDLAKIYPDYGFENHKGYGTLEHRTAIEKVGPCPEHRPTFAGVKEYL